MAINNMTLPERLCQDIERAWQGIVYDETLNVYHKTNAQYEYENCTVYEAGPQRHIAFVADSYEEQGATDVRNAIKGIKEKYPVCSKYNFTISDIEGGTRRKILLTLE